MELTGEERIIHSAILPLLSPLFHFILSISFDNKKIFLESKGKV
jgi:hypothetical protein